MDGVLAAIDRGAVGGREFEIINLGSGRPVRLDRLTEILSRTSGVRLVTDRLPAQPGDVTRTWADTSKAQRLLGWSPRTTLEEGLRLFAAKTLT